MTATTTFDLYMAGLVYGRVDGRYASSGEDIRLLMGSHAYGHAGRTYRNTSVDRTALDPHDGSHRRRQGFRPRSGPAGSNRQNVLIRLGLRMDCRGCLIWNGMTQLFPTRFR